MSGFICAARAQSARLVLLALLCQFAAIQVMAQGISAQVEVPASQQAGPVLESVAPRDVAAQVRVDDIPPFGASLFAGGFSARQTTWLNPGYRVMPGDQITVRAWGALELDLVLPVDTQGNIFIPQVGPVQVRGVSAADLNRQVSSAIRQVYTDNVSVYTNLQGIQPVVVFVTGFVKSPGRYSGAPSDSVLNYLDQAGGIDVETGSFRDIRVTRQGRVIVRVDLYPFLLDGELPRLQFEEGDTIVVGRRGPMVAVSGDVARPHGYELTSMTESVDEVMRWLQLKPGVSHVLLRGIRDVGPFSTYVSLDEFHNTWLQGGDELFFSADRRSDTIVVQVEGSFEGPSRFSIPRDARLMELLDSIRVDPRSADVKSVSIRRRSVMVRQRDSLDESLRRLETAYLGASSATVDESKIRVEEAKLIQDFVKRARQLDVSGRLVVAQGGRVKDVGLQDGDVVTIPARSDSVLVSGEVLVPQAMVYQSGEGVEDYIQRAGGFTDRANTADILLARQSGEVVAADDVALRPGDEVLVLPEVPTKNLELAKTLSQIVYQIAVATKVALDL
ncbi:polysaccharide biosynthesis/export family protein [Thiorhodococcus minor]|uniref:Polysaccharide export protein n=1 Tax=Thiorhodococcus minor TaxID=57489 RepID=A0A6M0JWX7_9GAMM|nr:polysaccharide biosynthesis/export family protein [Thiorhodococcus minor]NEV61123.1 polysaccharide export protein [Thiorhodococcus minor]